MHYARFRQRVAAFTIDLALVAAVTAVGAVLMGINPMAAPWMGGDDADHVGFQVLDAVFFFVAWSYFAIMESNRTQGTLGKLALGIKVTDLDGRKISFDKATGRFFGRIVSTLILLAGYIMAAFTERRQALHDRMAGTLVVTR